MRSAALGANLPDPEYLIQSWEIEQGLPNSTVTSMVQTPDGYLWFGTFGGLVRWDGVNFTEFNELTTPSLPNRNIASIYLDQSARMWVGARDALLISQGPDWTRFKKVEGWTGDYARTFAERAGVLLITSFNGKVYTNAASRLVELPPPGGARGNGYLGYVETNGTIWVAQENYLGSWNGQTWVAPNDAGLATNQNRGIGTGRDGCLLIHNEFELLRVDSGRIRSRQSVGRAIPYAWHLYETSDGNVWLPTVEKGLFCISSNGNLRRFTAENGLTYDSMRFAFEDREKNLWVGSSGGGLMRFKRRDFFSYSTESGLLNRNVKAVVEASPGRMLLGTHGGPLIALGSNGVNALSIPVEGDPATGYFVQCLLVDRQQNVWMGTYGRSVRVITNGVGRLINSKETGGNTTYALFEDAHGQIWIGGDRDLARFDGQQFHPIAQADVRLEGVRCFAEDPKREILWAATSRGLFQRNGERWSEVLRSGKPIARAGCLRAAPDGSLWIGANQGLLRWREGQWNEINDSHGLPRAAISSILEDDFGFWWMGSDRGIFRVNREQLARVADGADARLERQVFTTADGLPNLECTTGFQSVSARDHEGRLWFATPKGLAVVDPSAYHAKTNAPSVILESFAYTDSSGQRQEQSLAPGSVPRPIPAGSRELEVRYTAIHFAAPEQLRFAYQLKDETSEWTEAGSRRALYFHTLKPGPLALRIRAGNENGVWGPQNAVLALEVKPFFWQTVWFRILVPAGLLLAGCLTVWRVTHNKLRRHLATVEQERMLESERARLATVMDGTSDFVGFCDEAGNISYVNAAGRRMVGWSDAENLQGYKISDCHRPAVSRTVLEEALPQARRQGIWSGETRFVHRDGREIPASQVVIAHKDSDGALLFYSTIARDISEEKRSEDEIRQLNSDLEHRVELRTAELRAISKDLEAFSYSVAHDLRAPLQNISGYAGLLRTTAGKLDDISSRYLDIISTQVRRMASLIEDLLSFARVTRAELRKVPIDLNELVQQTRDSLGMEQQKRNIQWQVAPLPSVLADRGLVRQVLANLIGNAVKYSRQRDPAIIEIGTMPSEKDEVVIFVRDNGAGFDMKHAGKLFEAFHRLHSAEEFEGNGIGLANVQRILQRHGGRIWAEAKLDGGATFIFSLPK